MDADNSLNILRDIIPDTSADNSETTPEIEPEMTTSSAEVQQPATASLKDQDNVSGFKLSNLDRHVTAFENSETGISARDFLKLLELFFDLIGVEDAWDKIRFFNVSLKGDPKSWFSRSHTLKRELWNDEAYDNLIQEFKALYIPNKETFNAEMEFLSLRQQGPLDEYIKQFNKREALIDPSRHNEWIKAMVFMNGLNSGIRAKMNTDVETVAAAMASAQNVDREWRKRQEERKFSAHRDFKPKYKSGGQKDTHSYQKNSQKNNSYKDQHQKNYGNRYSDSYGYKSKNPQA